MAILNRKRFRIGISSHVGMTTATCLLAVAISVSLADEQATVRLIVPGGEVSVSDARPVENSAPRLAAEEPALLTVRMPVDDEDLDAQPADLISFQATANDAWANASSGLSPPPQTRAAVASAANAPVLLHAADARPIEALAGKDDGWVEATTVTLRSPEESIIGRVLARLRDDAEPRKIQPAVLRRVAFRDPPEPASQVVAPGVQLSHQTSSRESTATTPEEMPEAIMPEDVDTAPQAVNPPPARLNVGDAVEAKPLVTETPVQPEMNESPTQAPAVLVQPGLVRPRDAASYPAAEAQTEAPDPAASTERESAAASKRSLAEALSRRFLPQTFYVDWPLVWALGGAGDDQLKFALEIEQAAEKQATGPKAPWYPPLRLANQPAPSADVRNRQIDELAARRQSDEEQRLHHVIDRHLAGIAAAYVDLLEAQALMVNAQAGLAAVHSASGRHAAHQHRAVAFWQSKVGTAEKNLHTASTRLVAQLNLHPTTSLSALGEALVPLTVPYDDLPLEGLVACGLLHRPELNDHRAEVLEHISHFRWQGWRRFAQPEPTVSRGPDQDIQLASTTDRPTGAMLIGSVSAEITTAASAKDAAYNQMEKAREQVERQAEAYRAVANRHGRGRVTSNDLVQAVNSRMAAHDAYVKAIANYNRSQMRLLATMGGGPQQ